MTNQQHLHLNSMKGSQQHHPLSSKVRLQRMQLTINLFMFVTLLFWFATEASPKPQISIPKTSQSVGSIANKFSNTTSKEPGKNFYKKKKQKQNEKNSANRIQIIQQTYPIQHVKPVKIQPTRTVVLQSNNSFLNPTQLAEALNKELKQKKSGEAPPQPENIPEPLPRPSKKKQTDEVKLEEQVTNAEDFKTMKSSKSDHVRRSKIAKEILTTEETYVNSLKTCEKVPIKSSS